MSKINKFQFRKATVAVLTALMLIAIAAPLLSLATAASETASLSPATGPNGTLVKVQGLGFNAGDDFGDIKIAVDGHAVGVNSASNDTWINTNYLLKTDSNGVLTGYFIIYGLAVGPHTVIISDAGHSVVAGTFRVIAPTVTLTPSAGPAGESVIVTAAGFPTSSSLIETSKFGNNITEATFSGDDIDVDDDALYTYTTDATHLSSNVIATSIFGDYLGTYSGTVSLGDLYADAGPVFTITDYWGNTASTSFSLTSPTVTLTPSEGTVGSQVTAIVTGFAPNTDIEAVLIGNLEDVTLVDDVSPGKITTNEQGTAIFVFTIPAGDATTKSGVAGPQSVIVFDDKYNAGETTFTIKPKVTINMGIRGDSPAPNVFSGTSFVPSGVNASMGIVASGFLPESPISITAVNGITPSAWTLPNENWTVVKGTYENGVLYTDKNGELVVASINTPAPTYRGALPIRFSDGTNIVSSNVNVALSGNIIVASTPANATGQTGVVFTYFGTKPDVVKLNNVAVTTPTLPTASAWPIATNGTFNVPETATPGVKTLSATSDVVGVSYESVPFTVLTTAITVNPTSAAIGTIVTVTGTGFVNTVTEDSIVMSLEGSSIPAEDLMVTDSGILIAAFIVPNFIPGTNTLSVSDGINTATKEFSVASSEISITPSTGNLGSAFFPRTIAITGSGFKAGQNITVKIDSQAEPIYTSAGSQAGIKGLIKTNPNGDIILLSGIKLPTSATAGPHTITVTDASGAYAAATFIVQPQLTSLSAVRPGAQVTIKGTGFSANSVQTLYVNGTQTTWKMTHTDGPATAVPSTTSIVTKSNGNLYETSTVGFVVPSTEASGVLNITVTDAAGKSASTLLTILGTPSIKVGSSAIVAGTTADMGVSVNGTGFTPTTRGHPADITAKLFSGSTLVGSVDLSADEIDVDSTGAFKGLTFTVPTGIPAGEYTLQVSIGTTSVETATTTVTVLGAPSITVPATAASGSNVTIVVTGLTAITDARFGSQNLVVDSDIVVNDDDVNQFGGLTVSSTGANAYNTTTWFIVPTNLFAGSYLLTITDANTGLTAQAAVTVTPTIALTPTSGAKGIRVAIDGTGFASQSKISITFNGQPISLLNLAQEDYHYDETCTHGSIETQFIVPLTAVQTNTVTITDAEGNSASATFTVTNPTITLGATQGPIGTTVQIIGNNFAGASPITIQIGGIIVTPTTADLASNNNGQFLTYATIPAGLAGNVTVSATDGNNNVATELFTIGGSTGNQTIVSQTTMTSTAQTTTSAGAPTTTFTAGSTVKAGFILQSTGGSRDVIVAVTFQQGAKVYNMASFQTTMSTSPNPVSFSNLIPAGATGTWTATLQVFALDGVTPLGVTTLTFTVA